MKKNKIIALILAMTMLFALAACSSSSDEEVAEDEEVVVEAVTAENITVGVILLHDENIGYDFAHMTGIADACEELGISADQIIWKYNIPEDETCYDAGVELAEAGCDIIFADSFGHESYLWQVAMEYPEIEFFHATGTTAAASGLSNVHNYFTQVYESRYVAGVVAGMKLAELMASGEVTDPKVGYVGAYPYAEVVSGYTAFFLGVQSIVPEAYMEVYYTNSWADLTAEAEAANVLIASGCVIISQHADTTGAPSSVQAALMSGTTVYCVGYNIDMLSVAPDAALTSTQNNWSVLYAELISAYLSGEEIPLDTTVGYAEDGVMISTLGDSCAEGTAEAVEAVEAAIADGSLHVFDITTFTVGGETVESFDTAWGFEGIELIWDGYFHESEIVSAPLFELRVDGITELNS